MQFRGHSLPVRQSMSVSWALPCPISSAKSTHAISFDYWPLECVTSFRCITLDGILGRVEGQNITTAKTTPGQRDPGSNSYEGVYPISSKLQYRSLTIICSLVLYPGHPWCNCYRRRKWTRRHEFKYRTRLIAFHIALIPLGKV